MHENKTMTEKPTWLLKLEQESWQAELIISGLAIFGSLQLPVLIDRFGQWALTYFSPDSGFFMMMFLVFLHFASGILIFAFITHFILRAIWIGLIGLNSVFPNGIKTDGGMYSKIFMEKFKANYAHENYGIESIDKFCSGVFGVCTLVILFSIGFCSIILLLYGLNYLLQLFLPDEIITILGYVLFFMAFIPTIAMAILRQKKYEHSERLQARFYKFFNAVNIILLHVVRRPTLYISFLLSTNLKVKQYLFSMFSLFILLYGFSFYRLFQSGNFQIVNPTAFYASFERTDRTYLENYEEYLTDDSAPIYSAIIESKLIKGNMMSVFIPVFPNEVDIYTQFCGEYQEEEQSRIEQKTAHHQYYKDCYQRYHRLCVNDQLHNVELVEFTHPHRSTEGVITYIPTEGFIRGKNLLKVEKLKIGKDSIFRTMIIPFWYGGE